MVVVSELVVTEMWRAAARHGIPTSSIARVVGGLDVVDVGRAAFRRARHIPGPHLRSLDALHIAVALDQGLDTFVTYDQRQAEAATAVGLDVRSP